MSGIDPTVARQGQQAHVAVCSTAAAAEFVATTLAVHGVAASTHPYSGVYPSVDWVAGYRVAVDPGQVATARDLLAELARDDVAPV